MSCSVCGRSHETPPEARSRGHMPNRWQAELDTREQRAAEINARYADLLFAWDGEDDQEDRLQALKAAQGDVRIAKHLLYGQMLVDTGRVQP